MPILRTFAGRIGMKRYHSLSKLELCNAITEYIPQDPTVTDLNLTEMSCSDEVKVSRVIIHRKQLINVLFSEIMRPDLTV